VSPSPAIVSPPGYSPIVGDVGLIAIRAVTLTLIEKRKGRHWADRNATGAIMGAVALVAFAVVARLALDRWAIPVALVAATAAWVATGFFVYAVVRTLTGGSPLRVTRWITRS
jgi:ABC-type cobalamin transport system permease subunit